VKTGSVGPRGVRHNGVTSLNLKDRGEERNFCGEAKERPENQAESRREGISKNWIQGQQLVGVGKVIERVHCPSGLDVKGTLVGCNAELSCSA